MIASRNAFDRLACRVLRDGSRGTCPGPGDRKAQGRRPRLVAREAGRPADGDAVKKAQPPSRRRRQKHRKQDRPSAPRIKGWRRLEGGCRPGRQSRCRPAPAEQAIEARTPAGGPSPPRIKRSTTCLEKLGETKDDTDPGRASARPGPGRRAQGAARRGRKPAPAKLGGKDKDIDERLEELHRQKEEAAPADDEQRAGSGRRDHQGDERRRAAARQARPQRRHSEQSKSRSSSASRP